MKNNIFDFATGELSQDAFLCWCGNWYNDPSNPKLKQMAVEFMCLLLKEPTREITSVEIHRQFSTEVEDDNKEKIKIKIDVLFLVNETIAIILEDKKGSSEHDDQIARYKKGIAALKKNGKEDEKALLAKVEDEDIRTVYLKTGFFYDDDKCVKANSIIDGEQLLHFFQPYAGCSEILDSYIAKLEADLAWEEVHGAFAKNLQVDTWEWNVVKHHIAQYKLMRDIFPEEKWDRKTWEFGVYNGSSRGKQWTQMTVLKGKADGKDKVKGNGNAEIFWRIDSNSKSHPYISLRYYDPYDKNHAEQKRIHTEGYEMLKEKVQDVVEKNREIFSFDYSDVYPGYRANYKEADLFNLDLADILLQWEEQGDTVRRKLQFLTDALIAEAVM